MVGERLTTASEEGSVTEILQMIRSGSLSEDKLKTALDLLPKTAGIAARKCMVLDALEALGCADVPDEVQIKAVEAVASERQRIFWLRDVFASKEIPDPVGTRIVELFADNGLVEELLYIITKEKRLSLENAPSENVVERSRECLVDAVANAGEWRLLRLSKDQLLKIALINAKNKKNPLEKNGVRSEGSVRKPSGGDKTDKKSGALKNKV